MTDETRTHERPATFREVFGQSEYRAVLTACALSWIGDYIAKAAVTVLVYQETASIALSAAAFAVSYLPWLIGGPVLAAIAERHSYRTVMIVCDLARMVLVALVAIHHQPVWLTLALLFATTLANPPSQAARSALMPLILTGDRLVVGLSLLSSFGQAAQVGGYVAGAAIAASDPSTALLINSATFAVSALVIRFGVRPRRPASTNDDRRHLFREIGEGFGIVFGTPVLRAIAVMVCASMLFAIVPEGLAAAWASERATSEAQRGAAQALIMVANPIGFIVGGLVIGRLIRPTLRQALVRPFAVLSPFALVAALWDPSPVVVALLTAVCGFSVAGLLPVANGLFVQALPNGFRARAFGVMATGMQVTQGFAVFVTGLLAERFSIPLVVGAWSIAGTMLMLVAATQWPSVDRFDAAIAAANRIDQDSADRVPAQPAPVVTRSGRPADSRPDRKPSPPIHQLPGQHAGTVSER